MYPNGHYTLPQNPGPYKPVDVIEIFDIPRKTVDPKTPFRTPHQLRLARDEKNKLIWALQPGVRITPVQDVVVVQRVGTAPPRGPKYKAIIPKKQLAEWATGFTGKLRMNVDLMIGQLNR
jgi:hypothetical protein